MQFGFDIHFGNPLPVTRPDDPYFLTTVCFVRWITLEKIHQCHDNFKEHRLLASYCYVIFH